MLKLGKLTDYAIVVMGQLAQNACATHSASCLSDKTGIPEPTVAKVLKLLSKGQLVSSERGAAGGYKLARAVAQVSVADIITAMEGPISIVDCVDGHEGQCGLSGSCHTRGKWDRVNDAVKGALASVPLTEMLPQAQPKVYFVKEANVVRRA